MHYNVAQLLKEPTGAIRHYRLDEDVTGIDPTLVLTQRLQGDIMMLRTVKGILVTGNLITRIEVLCSRCLEPVDLPLEVNLEEEFQPTVDVITGQRLPMEEEDQALWIDAHHILDLTEVIRQNLLLASPLHPLCRESCAGICPECGKNLNEGPCECVFTEIDPRWSILASFKPI
ncbi:MAG: DUF177 domain-containing protein [Anaerolineae bacterium]|nr:DUF177 domain-containing protein [Anaerolineae bacterium]MDW8101060.1 DUF177 domain-containing protein [Anaerolineae bacterium]